jgi:TctA family transporter
MTHELDRQETGQGKVRLSRRAALRRTGGVGLMAALGVGVMEVLGGSPASAKQANAKQAGAKQFTQFGSRGSTSVATVESAPAATCCVTAYLAFHQCGNPCPSGQWCYSIHGCGLNGNYCLFSSGEQTQIVCRG